MNNTNFNLKYLGGIFIIYNLGIYTFKFYKKINNFFIKNKKKVNNSYELINFNEFNESNENKNKIISKYHFSKIKNNSNNVKIKLENIKNFTKYKWIF
jgi:hypothetical protein